MRELPILFNAEMVRAIVDGRKSMTRRPVKPQPDLRHCRIDFERGVLKESSRINGCWHVSRSHKCPFGDVGDRLWVRETWRKPGFHEYDQRVDVEYKADHDAPDELNWSPSIHMPRWAARITLENLHIRVERVQDITCSDMRKEGIDCPVHDFPGGFCVSECPDLRSAFANIWDSIYAKPRPVKENGVIEYYESFPFSGKDDEFNYRGAPCYVYPNPWVWVCEFKRVED